LLLMLLSSLQTW